jgi:hypothetical protein
MENLGPPLVDPDVRFMLDNIVDGIKDDTILLWQALDTHTDKIVWVIGRKISASAVLPCALLQPKSLETVARYAPAKPGGGWDYTMISKTNSDSGPIIKP